MKNDEFNSSDFRGTSPPPQFRLKAFLGFVTGVCVLLGVVSALGVPARQLAVAFIVMSCVAGFFIIAIETTREVTRRR